MTRKRNVTCVCVCVCEFYFRWEPSLRTTRYGPPLMGRPPPVQYYQFRIKCISPSTPEISALYQYRSIGYTGKNKILTHIGAPLPQPSTNNMCSLAMWLGPPAFPYKWLGIHWPLSQKPCVSFRSGSRTDINQKS